VGLAREEFIITTYVKAHPLALLDYDNLNDPAVKAEIDRLTVGYDDKPRFFVDKLAQGVAMIAAAFYPKDVILRLSDFKTNEYANLIGVVNMSLKRRIQRSVSAARHATTTHVTKLVSLSNVVE
jgi:pyruvate,water dikinase